MLSSSQQHKLLQWRRQNPILKKNEILVEAEPSVEREGPFYFVFTDKGGEKIRQGKQTFWSGQGAGCRRYRNLKRRIFCPKKMAHTRAYRKMWIALKIPNNQSR